MLNFILIIFLLIPTLVWGEYRAYKLLIENQKLQKKRSVASTLDHLQYPKYYPLQNEEMISIESSWMCDGNTSQFTEICPEIPSKKP